MNILYINHYGYTSKEFYCDKLGKPKKIIGDGGSNIHIHLIEQFSKENKVCISTYKNNYQIEAFFKDNKNVIKKEFDTPAFFFRGYSFFLDHFYKILILPLKAFFVELDYAFVFSTTDFLPDVIYAFIIKIRSPQTKWIASYFLDAPKPWAKNNPYRTSLMRYLAGVLYWFLQRFSFWLIRRKADFILVTSEPDVEKFISPKRNRDKIVVVQGGVDITSSEKYLKSKKVIPVAQRKYDTCFLGRFHYQKGVLELVDIWRLVCQKKPWAKLAMIGNGALEKDVLKRIKQYKLEKNIDLLGFLDGEKKYEIFKQSKIMIHPATYDSGGMAAAEGMAWELPAVSFDLEALKTYYPKGMIKTKVGDKEEFAKNIINLLEDKVLYEKTANDAHNLIIEVWDWDKRAENIFDQCFK